MAPVHEGSTDNVLAQFLAGVKGSTCFTETLKVYAPVAGKGRKLFALEKELTNIFKGSTRWHGTGCWEDRSSKKMVCEPVHVIELGACLKPATATAFVKAIKRYARVTNQQEIGIDAGRNLYLAGSRQIRRAEKRRGPS